MAHKHSVYDTDLHFKIDNITRNITSESGKVILMQNDHNSERFTFEIPRMVDGHDMSLCNIVEIHYINTDSNNKRNQTKDVYPVQDLQLSPDSNDVVICSWLVSNNATMYAGTLHFVVRYACVAEDSTIDYQWFTNIYSVISIAQGIFNTDDLTGDGDPDVLHAWKEEIMELAQPYVDSASASASAAKTSETNSAKSEKNAKASETNASASEKNAKVSETNAKVSEENAAKSEMGSKTAETNAKASEEIAALHADRADNMYEETLETVQEFGESVAEYNAKIGNTEFNINLETGELEYESPDYIFYVNEETGNLEWETLHEHSDTAETLIREFRNEKSDAIVLTASGKNIVVNDSSYDPIRGLRVFGRSDQLTTTGKNLFNINADVAADNVSYSRDETSVTITTGASLNADGYARLMFENIRVDANKTYTISFDTDSTKEITVGWYGCAKTANLSGETHYTVTLSNITTATFSVGLVVPNSTVKFSNIQIEVGSSETAYEPYTGGVAAPSMKYNQRLRTVGEAKNLLENKAASLNYGGVDFTVSEDGSVTVNGTATEILFFEINKIELKNGVSYILNGCPYGGGNQSYSIKCDLTDMGVLDTGAGVKIIGDGRKDCPITIRIPQGLTVNNLVFKPMIRYADIDDGAFEPYGKDSIEIGLYGNDVNNGTILTVLAPNGLPGIPVTDASLATYTDQNGVMWYADEIDFERGLYVKRIASITVDGSTPIERRYVVNSNTKARFKILDISDLPVPADQTSKGLAMCDRLSRVTASNTYNAIEGISIDATSNILIYIDSISEKSVAEMSSWLSENPLTILYALANPVVHSLGKKELDIYDKLYTTYPTMTVVNDSDAYMELIYNADTKSYIDNKIAELVAARMKEG